MLIENYYELKLCSTCTCNLGLLILDFYVNIIYYTDGNVQMVFQNTDETNYTTTFPVSYTLSNFFDGNLNIELECELTPEGKIQEQQRIFNLIIEGYEKSLAKYEQKVAEEHKLDWEELETDYYKNNGKLSPELEEKILKAGVPEELAADEMVRKVYLGQNFELRRTKIDFNAPKKI